MKTAAGIYNPTCYRRNSSVYLPFISILPATLHLHEFYPYILGAFYEILVFLLHSLYDPIQIILSLKILQC